MSKKKDPPATKIERTGQNSFTTHMEDGQKFHSTTDPKTFNKESWGSLRTRKESGNPIYIPENVAIHNVMSNEDRRRLGVDQDPALPDYQTT